MDTSRHGEKGDAKINESDSVDIVNTQAMSNEESKPQSLWATVFSCSALISSMFPPTNMAQSSNRFVANRG